MCTAVQHAGQPAHIIVSWQPLHRLLCTSDNSGHHALLVTATQRTVGGFALLRCTSFWCSRGDMLSRHSRVRTQCFMPRRSNVMVCNHGQTNAPQIADGEGTGWL